MLSISNQCQYLPDESSCKHTTPSSSCLKRHNPNQQPTTKKKQKKKDIKKGVVQDQNVPRKHRHH